MIAVIRLSVPYTGMILTAREPVALRNEAIGYGISQIDAGSNVGIGGYSLSKDESDKRSQFCLSDDRPLDEVVGELCEAGFLPSFCTGCYRLGRTGEHFMEVARPGFVQQFCTPNGILTLLEFLQDYASEATRTKALPTIEREVRDYPDSSPLKAKLLERMEQIRQGKRDLFF